MTPSRAVETLLEGLVDYAGLFPPAALPMRDATARYASYRRGPHARMLGRFVVPVARLDELALAAQSVTGSDEGPWSLATLAGAADAEIVERFNAMHVGQLEVDTIEAKAEDAEMIAALAAAFEPTFAIYVEVDVRQDPTPLVQAIAAHGLRAKVRTGGVTEEVFPQTAEVARFLAACLEAKVRFKATAGLHHPIRGEFPLTYAADGPRATMHGFLNLFLAALFLREGASRDDVMPLLEERDETAIVAEPDGLRWRTLRVSTAQVRTARTAFAGSFGSCSFEEPLEDLTRLSLL